MGTRTILLLIALLMTSVMVDAQDSEVELKNTASANVTLGVTEVSLIRINAQVISLRLSQQEAGLAIESSKADSSARLHMSSLISSQTRFLTAKITDGVVPEGTELQLVAMNPNANFVGQWGTLGPVITLDRTDRVLISDVASCYSGTETDDGIPLKFIYSLSADRATYGNIRATQGNNVVVTLTLSPEQ